MKHYEFHPGLFNPLFWHVRQHLSDPKIRFILVMGGSSAAKTYSIVQALILDQMEKTYNLAVFRKESTTIDDTVYSDYKTVSESLQLDALTHFLEKEMRVKATGSFVKFKGLDDKEKIKGLSAYQHVYMNELSKFDFSDFKEARRRLRGRPNQKIIADWNPISEEHWIKTDIIDKETWKDLPLNVPDVPTKFSALDPEHSYVRINDKGNTLLICTTHRDNYWVVGHPTIPGRGFVDQATLDEFAWMQANDENDYRIYANGIWGRIQTGLEFFDNFSRNIHVKPHAEMMLNMDAGVISGFDFNNHPYSTCLLFQTSEDETTRRIKIFDEVCLKPPTNTLEDIYDELDFRHEWIRLMFYAIDPSGRSKHQRKTRQENLSYDDTIRKVFAAKLHNRSDMTTSKAPPLAFRRRAMKQLLSGNHKIGGKNVVIEISDKCKNLIQDLEKLLIDTDGSYKKVRVTDKNTGISYEPMGHCADAMIYVLASMFETLFFRKR